jgi:hypothetical protein
MSSRKLLSAAVAALCLLTPFASAPALGGEPAQSQISAGRTLIVFYSPGCHRCTQIKATLLPEIESRFGGKVRIEYRDVNDIENYKLMLSLEKKHNVVIENTLPVFYFEGGFVNGEEKVRDRLLGLIARTLSLPSQASPDLPEVDLVERFKSFAPLAVAGAGLIDGINPCAFTVIIFFISFLALQGYRKIELVFIGAAFIFAVFLTYLSLGLGAFEFLYRLRSFWLVARIFNIGIGILCVVLGALALYDFFTFKKTRKSDGLMLQLPPAIKNRIHSVIGLHYRKSADEKELTSSRPVTRLVVSALITGFLVSLLEAVCTGQVYLPTITFVLKTSPLKLQAFGFLVFYNLMFIAPLFVIFILALAGTTSGQFAQFLKRHLLGIKILTAALFFSLGALLIWRG